MSIPTLDTTIGGANANSYIDLTAAETYFDSRLNSDAWTGASADDKSRALLMAATQLQTRNWMGDRMTVTQRLAWPRWGVYKVDSIGVSSYGYGALGWLYGDQYLPTEIPQQVKDAQCELAIALLEGAAGGGEEAMASFTADGLSVNFRNQGPAGALPSRVSELLAGLTTGNRLIRG